jgi:hypothetical protein
MAEAYATDGRADTGRTTLSDRGRLHIVASNKRRGTGQGDRRRLRADPPWQGADHHSAGQRPADAPDPGAPTAFDRFVLVLFVATGVLAWLVAGLVVLLALTLEPRAGLSGGASLFKVADVTGWVVIGGFVIRDALARRRRTLAMGLAAWAWVFVLSWLIGQTATLSGGV